MKVLEADKDKQKSGRKRLYPPMEPHLPPIALLAEVDNISFYNFDTTLSQKWKL